MIRLPRSLAGRFALGSAFLVLLALVLAGIGTGLVLHRFMIGQLDQRLDEKIASLASRLEDGADGVRLTAASETPPFDRPRAGWYWEIRSEDDTLIVSSPSLGGQSLDVVAARFRWQEFWNLRPRPAEGHGPRGEPLHLRVSIVPVGSHMVTIIASAPLQAIGRPVRDAMFPILATLLLLGLGLAVASLIQVRLGLRPLKALRTSVSEVRAGRLERLPTDQPDELRPLADELNTLLAQNAEGLERSRRNVANLAHSLKTPLATLALSLQKNRGEGDAEALRQVEQMERQIRHHLGRARAAALDGPLRIRTEVAPHIADLAAMFDKVHADRGLVFASDVPAGLSVACEPQDLDEMLGNVIDNAYKWARSKVAVGHVVADGQLRLVVEDDGPGLKDDQTPTALLPGRRLDETIPGDGFGLAIVREIAELYNGGITLGRSSLGGLRVEVTLPLARG